MSIPEVFFRETIDLNRYSNAVATEFQTTYNDIILVAAKKLKQLNIDVIEVPLKQINIENNTSTVSPLKDGIKMLYGLFRLKKLIKRI